VESRARTLRRVVGVTSSNASVFSMFTASLASLAVHPRAPALTRRSACTTGSVGEAGRREARDGRFVLESSAPGVAREPTPGASLGHYSCVKIAV
jgi:hypothetical protein